MQHRQYAAQAATGFAPARFPADPSHDRRQMITALAGLAGAASGVAVAQEQYDRIRAANLAMDEAERLLMALTAEQRVQLVADRIGRNSAPKRKPAPPDPTFALVERFDAAHRATEAFRLLRQTIEGEEETEEAYVAAIDHEMQCWRDLMQTTPTTPAGAHAYISTHLNFWHVQDVVEKPDFACILETLGEFIEARTGAVS